MEIEEALFAYLSSHVGVTAFIGDRVHPFKLPQNPTYPAMTYQQISGDGQMAHDGPGDLWSSRYQFDHYALTYGQAKMLAREVRAALNGYRGMMGGASGVFVAGIFFASELDLYEDAAKVYRVPIDFNIMYKK